MIGDEAKSCEVAWMVSVSQSVTCTRQPPRPSASQSASQPSAVPLLTQPSQTYQTYIYTYNLYIELSPFVHTDKHVVVGI